MGPDIGKIAHWARDQGWTVADDSNRWTARSLTETEGAVIGMEGYSVDVNLVPAPTEQDLIALEDTLEALDAWASRDGNQSFTVTFDVDADGVVGAVAQAMDRLGRSGTGGTVIGLSAQRWEDVQRQAEDVGLPQLLGASEVADLLKVSRQRVHQLSQRDDFPAPLVRLRMGPLWDAQAVAVFAGHWERRPGRPPHSLAG